MLKEAVPNIGKVAILINPDARVFATQMGNLEKVAAALKVETFVAPVRSQHDLEAAFALMRRGGAQGLVSAGDSVLVANMRRLGELSSANRLPGAGSDEYVEGGGLLAYGVNFPELWGRSAYFVDRILKGASPGDIPVEQASKFDLEINLKTAKALGIRIPPSLLVRADRVIE
jgi:putative ABC transport system substrate-binding protein